MKLTRILTIVAMVVLVLTTSCSSGSVLTRATGLAYEIVVSMDKTAWEGEAGTAVKADLQSEIPCLPQIEPSLKVTYVEPNHFDGLLQYVRNILIVKINPSLYTKVSLSIDNDMWAKGQVVLTLCSPDQKMIVDFLLQHKNLLSNRIVDEEMQRSISLLKSEYCTTMRNKMTKKFGYDLNIPSNMTYFKDTTDFIWASNNAATGFSNVIVYSFPYTDQKNFTKSYLIAMRDSIMKKYLPGAHPGSYMKTEQRAEVIYKAKKVNGVYCGELRGLWAMEGDMMGGPFVSHAVLDEKNQKVIVAEGFVYAPETYKRNYIRRVEAALYTLRPVGSEVNNDVFGIYNHK